MWEEPLVPNSAVCYGIRTWRRHHCVCLVVILSSSASVSKDNTGAEECLCRDNLFFRAPEAGTTAKWRDVLEREQFSSQIVAISGDEAHCVSK